jgi:predicted transcriptional regulator
MQALWRRSPASARQVRTVLERGRLTMPIDLESVLGSLVERGAIAVRREGRTNRYVPLLARDEARGAALRQLCDDAFGGGAAGLLEFLLEAEDVPAHDRAAMARLLAQRTARDKEGPR